MGLKNAVQKTIAYQKRNGTRAAFYAALERVSDKIKDKYMLFSYDYKEHEMSEISEKYILYEFFHYFYEGLLRYR